MWSKLCFVLATIGFSSAAIRLQEQFAWNVMDWNYPDEFSRTQALDSGALIPENALPVGIERWKNKLFVSVPRWQPGIPATLNYIPLDAPYEPSPKLTPYPSWKGNELGNCQEGLTTVYRMKVDKCDRLWVLDTGTYGYDPNVTNPCPYALNVYDLNTDQRIRRYVFRPEDIVPSTFIANIALDMGKSCDDTFAYFSDELGYGLISYSWEQNKSWRFSHSFFFPDPLLSDYNIAGLNFQWGSEGIFGITTSPIGNDGYRTLYFTPLASHTEFAVSTRVLRDESKVSSSYRDFRVVGARGPDSHTTAKVMSEDGVQLFSLIDQNAIGCWNAKKPYKPENIAVVDKDDVGLVFPTDVKIDEEEIVWVMSDRMNVFLEAELDYSDINFRVYMAPLKILLRGTVCDSSKSYTPYTPNAYNQNKASPLFNTLAGPSVQVVSPRPLQQAYLPEPNPLTIYNAEIPDNVVPLISSYVTKTRRPNVAYKISHPGPKTQYTNSQTYTAPGLSTSNLGLSNLVSQNIGPQQGISYHDTKPWWTRGSYEVEENS